MSWIWSWGPLKYSPAAKNCCPATPAQGVDAQRLERILPYLGSWWCLPGGTIELNETPEETIRRELREELHLRVVCGERLYEAPMPHEDGTDVGILVDALTDPLLPGVDPSVTA